MSEVVSRILSRIADSFDLHQPLGGEPLVERLGVLLEELEEGPWPEWGQPGRRDALEHQPERFFTFYYRPHLFPDMDPALRLAHKLQFHLLPRELPPGSPVKVAAVLESYCHLSGDLLGWRPLAGGGLLLWILDISGHGVRAGLASAVVKLLVDELEVDGGLGPLVDELNRQFLRCRNPADRRPLYVTGCFVQLDADGRGCYTSAGHPPALLRRLDGTVEHLGSTDRPIGLFDDEEYSSSPLELAPGEMLMAYSDGLMEARDADERELGLERVEAVVAREHRRPEDLTGALYRAVATHHDLSTLADDLTFLAALRPRGDHG